MCKGRNASVPSSLSHSATVAGPDKTFHLVVPGPPVPLPRPRFGQGRVYEPQRVVNAKRVIGAEWLRLYRGQFLQGPVCLTVTFAQRRQATARPDVDNLAKLVLDALSGIAFADDAHVVELTARKRRADTPQTIIEIWSCTDGA